MQESYAVVRAIGRDRIGIVGDLTTLIEQAGCNIEESKMAVLGGEFAVMILVSGSAVQIEAFSREDFSFKAVRDLHIDIIPTRESLPLRRGVPYQIETVSLDSPGIVHAVTALLAAEQINIEELETDSAAAPFTGSPMFTMTIRITLEGPKRASALREKLVQLAFERDLDISFASLASSVE